MVIKLSERSINNAIGWLNGMKDDIVDVNGQIVSKLCNIGSEKANDVNYMVPSTGAEMSTVYSEYDVFKGKGAVVLQGPNAVFDEFGTGEVGRDNPHPQAGKIRFAMPPYTGYVSGPVVTRLVDEQGRHYWNVPAENRPSNEYVDPDDGKTYGLPSGKQIYSASVEVRKQAKNVAVGLLNDAMKKYNRG